MVPEEALERAAVDDVSPRYLRKQKATDVKRRRVRQVSSTVRRVASVSMLVIVGGALVGGSAHFLLFSPQMLLRSSQVRIEGTHYVSQSELMSVFAEDMGKSVLRVPLDRRRTAIERMPWVKQATIERVLPDRLIVQVVERDPVAFLRTGSAMELIDASGAILNRPPDTNLNLPVVSGIGEQMPADDRAERVGLFVEFMKEIAAVRGGAPAEVSEADLSSPEDVQATMAGIKEFGGQGPVVVHFGNQNFAERYRSLIENFASWQAKAGNIEAVDLRFDGQALVTPAGPLPANGATASPAPSAPVTAPPPPARPARHRRRRRRPRALATPPTAVPASAARNQAEQTSSAVLVKTRKGAVKQ